MTDKSVIAVVGATGAQGGGLVRAILSDPNGEFSARALTRNAGSDKAKALADAGAEVVEADIGDLDSVTRAFTGAAAAYCVTNFWEHFSPDTELAQARTMAAAAKQTGVGHLIWSTLEDTRKWVPLEDDRMPTLMEHYKVPHFDSKGQANHVFADAGVPTTCLLTAFYWDNLIHFGMGPRKQEDGTLAFALPMGDKKLPGIAAEDIGRCAYGVFKTGAELAGKTIGIAGEHLTGVQMAAALTTALGRQVSYAAVPFDVYRGLDFPGAADLGNMFQFKHDFEDYYCGIRDLQFSRQLNPALQTFAEWLSANKEQIPIQ
jgi:uncharacterized protein YbjT (DUF2867 family)